MSRKRIGRDPVTGRAIFEDEGPSRARYAASGGSLMALDVDIPTTDTVGAGPVERRYTSPTPPEPATVAPARPRTTEATIRASRARGRAAQQAARRANLIRGREVWRAMCAMRVEDRDERYLDALTQTGSLRGAAALLGVSKRRVQQVVTELRERAKLPDDVEAAIRSRARGKARAA